jgi:hypothetical protein
MLLSYEGNTEMSLWRRISTAQVSPVELAKPVDEDADITTLASGVLISEAGRLAFVSEAAVLERGSFKVSAIWTVLRVRHSGPGLMAPRVEYYFTVQPASHLTLLDHLEKIRNKIIFKKPFPKPKPTYFYKEVPVPVYSNVPGQYYTPQFVSRYRNTVQKFVLSTPEDNSDREKDEPFYILQTPRYATTPSFPRLSQLTPQVDVPQLINVVIPRRPVHDPATQETMHHEGLSTVDKFGVEPRTESAKDSTRVTSIEQPTSTSTTTARPVTVKNVTELTTEATTTTVQPEETTTLVPS